MPEGFSEFIPAGKQPVPPSVSAAEPVASETSAAPEGFSEFIPAKPPTISQGYLDRLDTPASHIPRDVVDIFMEGLHTTLRAPGQTTGFGESSYRDLAPDIEQRLKSDALSQFLGVGYTDEQAKVATERVLKSIRAQEGRTGLSAGPLQMFFAFPLGIYRSMVSRPAEQIAAHYGWNIPKEAFEAAGMISMAVHGLHKMSRVTVDQSGNVKVKPVGEPPIDVDFENAASLLTKKPPPIIEGEFTVVGEEPRLAEPQKALPAPGKAEPLAGAPEAPPEPKFRPLGEDVEEIIRATKEARGKAEPPAEPPPMDPTTVEHNLRRLWEEDGIHPAEVVQDIGSDPFLRDLLTRPIEAPARPEPAVPTRVEQLPPQSIQQFYDAATAINTRLNRSPDAIIWFKDLVSELGITKEELKAQLDIATRFPDVIIDGNLWEVVGSTSTKDPRQLRIAVGNRDFTGIRFRLAPQAEPPEYKATQPTPEQAVAMVDAGHGEPPRSANLSPDGLPRWMYPQVAEQLAAGQTPGQAQPPAAGGGAQPPRVPPTGLGPAQQPPPAGGGMPPPPPQGPPLAPAPPQRPPFFTYDDRSGFAKAFSNFVDTWVRTFQPELKGSMRSDLALQADPMFAKYKASSQNLKDQIIHNQEADYQYWRGQSEADRLRYLHGFESGRVPAQWQARADVHKQMMDYASKLELQYGSKADYFENYFPHLFQDPLQARNYVEGRTAQMGPNWFQKERTFKSIKDAMDAGLRLVNTNPEYLISHRLASTVDMLERMDLLDHLKELGGAVPVAEARAERAQRIEIAQQLGLPIDVTTIGRDLSAEGWIVVNAPGSTSGRGLASAGRVPDDRAWFISPDLQPLWQNAMDAKGLWGNEGNIGTGFRVYMAVKNVFVPLKLALSAFHPLHVVHINMMAHVRQAVIDFAKGNYGDALKEYGDIIYDPIAAAFPGIKKLGIPAIPHEGRLAREAWLVPEDARTPTQQLVVQTMKEGGLVANQSKELTAGSRRAFEEALDKHQWFRTLPAALREGVRMIGAPIFEHWIPNLKVGAYLRDAANFAQQHPDIWADDVQRTVALRTIAKSTENRYGEMFYGSMFWNRHLKDIGVGGLLSLGWQTGFVREYLGGVTSPFTRGVRALARPATPTEETIYKAQSKASYAFTYMAGSMIIAGIITYASTGEDPEGMDWFLPRTGRTNPDGTPHRITHMSYSREGPMLEKHIQASGSVIGGIADTMQSKLAMNTFIELYKNRDYFGNEIVSERSPLYLRGAQRVNHLFVDGVLPISFKSAAEAKRTGGGWDEQAMAMLGFGPAPSYANKTPLQNMINGLFQRYAVPELKPQEMGARSGERRDYRSLMLQAQQRGDTGAVTDNAQKYLKAGGSKQGLTNILMHIPEDVGQFRALPEVVQGQVMDAASPAEKMRYRPYLKSDVASRVADMQVEALRLSGAGDQAGAQKIAGDIKGIIAEAANSGKITNLGEFQKSVMKNMQFRLQPEAAAQKADVPRQKKILRMPPEPQPQPAMQ